MKTADFKIPDKKQLLRRAAFFLGALALLAAGILLKSGNDLSAVARLFKSLGAIWAGYFLVSILLHFAKRAHSRAATVCSMVRSLCSCAAALLSIFFGLRALGIDMTASLASVGVMTLIIGFGAQSLIEDIVTGIFLISEGKFSIGDIIVLDDFRGKVVDISIRTTTIEDLGGNRKVINNSDIRNFQNLSQNTSVAVSAISVTYGADLRAVERVIADNLPAIYERNRGLFLSVPTYLGVDELGESGVTLKFAASVKEENIFLGRRTLNRELKLLFDDNGIGQASSFSAR